MSDATRQRQRSTRPAPPDGVDVASAAASAAALIGIGTVRHRRLRPVEHAFAYPTYFLLLPLRSLRRSAQAAVNRNRFGLLSFHDADHGVGGPDCLAWVDGLLRAEGIADADGEVWLHSFPRVLGYVFKPVSFWYCHRRDNSLAAVLVEVNNTFGERHCYLLTGPGLAFGVEQEAKKVFHVSPFCDVAGRYRFRFMKTSPEGPGRTVVRIDHDDATGPLLHTSVSGDLQPLTASCARSAFFRMPLMTLGVIARIHWQAFQLFRRRVSLRAKPDKPATFVSR